MARKAWSNETAESFLRSQIAERRLGDNGVCDDLNHISRWLKTLEVMPADSGKVLDVGSGSGNFSRLVQWATDCVVSDVVEWVPGDLELAANESWPNEVFDGCLLLEVVEHFARDPMRVMAGINRALRMGGWILLTTPNAASEGALMRLLEHRNPGLYPFYSRRGVTNRHNREYTAPEVMALLGGAGFVDRWVWTENVYESSQGMVNQLPLRGDTVFAVARKGGGVTVRFPEWLYVS